MNTPFWDATHLLRKLNSALPKGWEVYSITLTKDGPEGFAQATGACYRPYKCGGRAGSLSTNVIPKTRMTFTVPWPLPTADIPQIPLVEDINKTVVVCNNSPEEEANDLRDLPDQAG